MRNLTKTLGDGNKYKFKTLTRREANGFLKEMRNADPKREEYLRQRDIDGTITVDESKELETIENHQQDVINKMIRISLSHNHHEFAITGDEDKDKQIDEKLADLMDYRDLNIISSFVMTGNLPKEEEIVLNDDDISM